MSNAAKGFDMVDGDLGRGTVLAGRYRLDDPVPSDLPGTTAWVATDQILARQLRVVLLREGEVARALDSARRAALVSDPRLVRILDVLDDAETGLGVLVTEAVTGPSLVDLLSHGGPLPADQARAIVGEVAQALEVARRRGVHHLALRPSVVHVDPDSGAVLVTGLGVDAALLGLGIGDARSTTRSDTVAAVQVLYAALTGTWPGADLGTGASSVLALPGAAGADGSSAHGPVPPADVVPGVPNDLDTLCVVTLGPHDDGPQSPAELAAELEPWTIVRGITVGPRAAAATPPPPAAPTPTGPPARPSVLGAMRAVQTDAPAWHTPAAAAEPPPPARNGPPQRQPAHTVLSMPTAGTDLPGTPPPATPRRPSAMPQPSSFAPQAHRPPPAPAPPVAVGRAPAAGPPPAAGPSPASARPRPTTAPRSGVRPMTDPLGFDSIVHEDDGLTTRRFDPTKLILGVVGLAIVVGLFLALRGITAPIEAGTAEVPKAPVTSESPSADASTSPSPSPSQSETTSATPTGPAPVIASGKQLDPLGDENEHPEAEGRAVDGDMSTYWFTRTYRDASYGMKKGVGYAVTLEGSATVSTVTLHTGGEGGRVEVRATDPGTPTDGPVLAEGPMSAETVLTFTAPTEAESIVLWFTKLPVNAEGKNRLEIFEIEVG